jgi:lysophospholipase L1-like esterase
VRVVFFGDSLTEGVDGASYLRILERRLAAERWADGVELVNAGVGGDTVVHLVRRAARDVAPLRPDWVVVFIGVNDCTTALLPRRPPTLGTLRSRRYFRQQKGLRVAVTPERYQDGLRALVDALARTTEARVTLCTPALIGESPASRPWRLLDEYAAIVRRVGAERDCPVIDVHGAFARALTELPPRSPLAPLLGLRARLLRDDADYEMLAQVRGYRLVYDGVHLTEQGASLVAAVFHEWLERTVATASV